MSQQINPIYRRSLPPRTSQGVVNRPRLTHLSQKLLHHRLALVHAPAGSGKTTLLAQWHQLLKDAGADTVWYSAHEDDGDPLGFAEGLLRSVEHIEDSPTIRATDGGDALGRLLIILAGKSASRPVALFVDDYHLAEGGDGGEAINRLLSARIPQLTLILGSRMRPSIPVSRLRVSGELMEVAVDDLSFSEAEVEDFFNVASPISLSPDQRRQMCDYTEGWAAGLRLASLVLERSPHALTETLPTGSHRDIADYFLEEVILDLPEEVYRFLTRTSILDSLNADLCNAVTGGENGMAMLAFLEEAQLFIVALPGNQRWYKYHHLFQEFLQARLFSETRGEAAQLHSRAAEWFIDNGSPMDAVRHAFLARRPDWAAELIEGYCLYDYLSYGRFETFSRWMQQLPRESREERPLLLFLQAWRFINLRRFLQAEQILQTIEAAAADPQSRMLAIARAAGLDVEGRLHLMRALIGAYGGNLASGFKHIRHLQGRELDQLAFGQVDLDSIHSYLAYHQGDLDRAERLTWRANGVYHPASVYWGGIHSRCIAAMSYIARGLMQEAQDVIEAALQLAELHFGEHSYMVALPSALLGLVLYDHGNLQGAEQLWLRALPPEKATDVSGLSERVLIAAIGLARLYDLTGRGDEAASVLLRFSRHAYANEDFRLEFQLAIERTDRALRLGNEAEGRREWERVSLQLPEARERYPETAWQIWEPVGIVEAKLSALTGDLNNAADHLQVLAKAAAREGRLLSERQIATVAAALLSNPPPPGKSIGAARQLLTLAFLATADLQKKADIGQTQKSKATREVLPYGLTQREADVLDLMRHGLSNGEIAARLEINLNTVKSHSKSVFSKLGVKSRTQAVLKAIDE